MRTALAATAFTALALFTAAPAALATGDGTSDHAPGADQAPQAERLMRAADRFDRKAGALRLRADRLRATAMDLREEAEDLAGGSAAAAPEADGEFAREIGDEGTPPPPPAPTEDGPSEDGGAAHGESGCGWDGEDELGFSREDAPEPPAGDDSTVPGNEVCELLRTADRLEHRAGALYVAADRLQAHACKLREKAAKLLGASGEGDAERLLAKAAKLRQAASKLRDRADELRETAFEGAEVDEDVVESVAHLEQKAATYDKRADRLEARAASVVD